MSSITVMLPMRLKTSTNQTCYLSGFRFNLILDFSGRTMWIGVSDIIEEGRWEYISTQEVVSHTDFAPGQPDPATGEDCVALWKDHHGQWDDAHCASNFFFICEEIPQALQYKFVSDISLALIT